jgi:hypothetical protein
MTYEWPNIFNGERGIRTPGTGVNPYNGLANRRLQPLGHLSLPAGKRAARSRVGIIPNLIGVRKVTAR